MRKAATMALALVLAAAAFAAADDSAAGTAAEPGSGDAPDALPQSGISSAHDPTVVAEGAKYYRFSTGPGLPIAVSSDLKNWQYAGRVFSRNPQWTKDDIPGSTDFWAPEVVQLGGRWRVYYSVSTFGQNRSAIGVASNATLDPDSPDYAWVDEGAVIESKRLNNYNCIDPCVATDSEGTPWLSFGSFWSGIKLVRLDAVTGKLTEPKADDPTTTAAEPLAIARRMDSVDAIEGSYILPKDGKYYLFVSFDACCQGSRSTYNMRVGRSDVITGPYLDRDGVPMLKGGGTLLRAGGERYKGTGHNSILIDKGVYYLVYHSYDALFGGLVRMRIEPLKWNAEGWPYVTGAGAGPQ
jgi:Beta-xylosidase